MISKQSQPGFSLVETLVAISILLIVIVGPMSIVSNTAKSTSFSSDQVTAFFLAQEGAELAQKARDDLVLEKFNGGCVEPWLVFLDDTGAISPSPGPGCDNSKPFKWCLGGQGCGLEIDTAGGTLIDPFVNCDSSSDACLLHIDSDFTTTKRSRYTYESAGNEPTPYKRKIYFEYTANDYEIKIRSVVEWFPGNTRDPQQVEVETYLFDIYR